MQSETERVASGMIAKTLPKQEWTHHAHLRTGLWHVLQYDAPTALELMRERIRAYNLATGGQNTDTSGYHETITRFYLVVIRALVQRCGAHSNVDELAEQVIMQLGAPELPFRYYSRERLFSVQARAGWLEPDLEQLPD